MMRFLGQDFDQGAIRDQREMMEEDEEVLKEDTCWVVGLWWWG